MKQKETRRGSRAKREREREKARRERDAEQADLESTEPRDRSSLQSLRDQSKPLTCLTSRS
ncbi:hypothetical protein TIFTF001_009431 [Ficus carica]|uniref:Uncharacterized protein n=1 Tax=Ficus carica TaxID=3494 RepID=A0AA87ZN45_FICCA|nr:hypothetical protein TIFTF001_009431 [Ficus carica]